ncbi:MAG TPA: CPBP family glutamic-type intramembrane protease [Polyangiaceae bacterium]|jgi:membrane protease YdiL (CAAX protease family)
MVGTGWRARADEVFLAGMPGRRRLALEALLVLMLVFGEGAASLSPVLSAIVVIATLALALALVRPWAALHGAVAARVGKTLVVVVAVVLPALFAHQSLAGLSRHLGVGVSPASTVAGDPPRAGGVVLVETVEPRSPADGVLVAGDRIVAVGGLPLDGAAPVTDLQSRTHGDELPEDTTVTVLREGRLAVLPVHVPRVHDWRRTLGGGASAAVGFAGRHIVLASAVRGALVIALLLLLVRADGQPFVALGIASRGAWRELLASSWMALGTFGVQIAVAIPVGIIGVLAGAMEREASQRTGALQTIAGQGSVPEFVAGVMVAAAFEEVAFRGFLTPRVRVLTGSWPWAIAVVSVLFGAGHLYEGPLAIVQTAGLGVYFSVLLLARRRLLGPTVAHAAFNTVMFLIARMLMDGRLLERLRAMAPHG